MQLALSLLCTYTLTYILCQRQRKSLIQNIWPWNHAQDSVYNTSELCIFFALQLWEICHSPVEDSVPWIAKIQNFLQIFKTRMLIIMPYHWVVCLYPQKAIVTFLYRKHFPFLHCLCNGAVWERWNMHHQEKKNNKKNPCLLRAQQLSERKKGCSSLLFLPDFLSCQGQLEIILDSCKDFSSLLVTIRKGSQQCLLL